MNLYYQPTHIEVTIEGRLFIIGTPINWYDPNAMYYASIMSLLDKKHSFEYYMMSAFENK